MRKARLTVSRRIDVEVSVTGSIGDSTFNPHRRPITYALVALPCDLDNKCTVTEILPQRNTRYQAGATPYLGRTSTGWITPASWRTDSALIPLRRPIMYAL